MDRLYAKRSRSGSKAEKPAGDPDRGESDPSPAPPVSHDGEAETAPGPVPGEATASPEAGEAGGSDPESGTGDLESQIVDAIKTVFDPEIPVNIYDLGLIYEIKVEPSNMVHITMTLTAPNCPAAGILPGQVQSVARGVPGVKDVELDLVFDPPWGPDRMSESAKLELGMM